ncbi:MAG: phage tail tape measure protein [Planococcaceae bacterium]|nr:phage tail tape measure protein [Planococcaceae bacterium]
MAEEVGALKVGLSIDSAKFEQSMKSVDRNLKALGGEMAIVRARGKEWGNSLEGLGSKQKTLTTLLESQDVKVKKLNESYQKAVTEQGANSKAAEDLAIKLNKATAEYVRTETELSQVTAELKKQEAELKDNRTAWDKTADSMNKAGDKLQSVGDKAKTAGKGLSIGLTAPILAVGAAGIKAFSEVDEAMDTVITKTGATGKAVEGLEKSFQTVAKRVPNDLLSVGEAIGEVNTQFGFLGKELEDNSELMLQFADINGTDVTSSSIAAKQAIQAYGLANEELGKVLDSVTKTAQDTGQSVDFLFDKAVEGAPQIKALGLSFAQGTALIGSFEKSGVDSAGALSSLSKASIVYAKDGKTMEEGLKDTIKSITSAKDETEALTVAAKVFGTKGAVRMVDAIKRGTFNLEEFADAGTKATGAVKKTFNETIDPIDEAKIALNNAKLAMSEVGETVQISMLPFLKKATKVLGDLTEKFQDLDPETKESIVKFGLLAAAIGPAVLVGGHMATSLGSILKLASPLISKIGKLGLAGSFTALANPVGLTVVGVTALTAAVGLGVVAYKKSNEVNLKALETKQKEIDRNDKLIESFDSLRYKNKLSNEQMLRYLDIQAEIESTNAPERVAALKDEQARLLEKSTLTNDEMGNFLELNQEVIDAAPSTVKAISSQGAAFAENTNALKELNAEKAKELKNGARQELNKALEQETKLRKDSIRYAKELKEIEKETQANTLVINQTRKEISETEARLLDLQKQKNDASADELITIENRIRREQDSLLNAEEQLERAKRQDETLGKQFDKRGKLLETNRTELAQLELAQYKYEEIILAQVGITAERGRSGQQLSDELRKLYEQKRVVSENLSLGKIGTSEYQEQNAKIDTQIGKLQNAQSELQLINDTAGKKVFKDVDVSINPKGILDDLDSRLRRPITKTVSISYNSRNGPQDVGAYATGTRYAPGGMALVGEEGPELMYVPSGSRIVTNDDSQKLLNKWNIPSSNVSSGNTQQSSGGTSSLITGNTFLIREEADINKIARQLFQLQQKSSRGAFA